MKFFMGKREKTYNRSGEEHVMTEYRPRLGRIIACCAALLIVLGAGLSSFTVVGAGHTGVVSTFGQVSENVLQEGFHFKAPWQKVTKMDNRIVKLEVSTEAFSSDLQTVSVNLAVNYRVDTTKSYSIVKNVGTNYEDVLMTPAVNEVMKSIMASYTAEQSITNRNVYFRIPIGIERVHSGKSLELGAAKRWKVFKQCRGVVCVGHMEQ